MQRKRIFYLIIGAIAMLFMGLLYSWSNFTRYFVEDLNCTHSQLSWVFTTAMIFFCIANVIGGFMQKKHPVRVLFLISMVLTGGGYILVSFTQSYALLLIGYGVLAGSGVGMSYGAINSTLIRWFPDRAGVVTGVLLMSFGLSTLTLGSAAVAIIEGSGRDWRTLFLVIGIIFVIVFLLATVLIKRPTEDVAVSKKAEAANTVERDYKEFLRSRFFWMTYIWGTIIAATGLAVIGRAATVAETLTSDIALCTLLTGIVSISNGVGRLVFGAVLDSQGSRRSLVIGTLTGVVALVGIVLGLYLGSMVLLMIGYIFLGINYGGTGVVVAGTVARLFGTKSYGVNMPIYLTHLILAALIGPQLVTALQDGIPAQNSYLLVFVVLLIANIVALVLSNFLVKEPWRRAKKTVAEKA